MAPMTKITCLTVFFCLLLPLLAVADTKVELLPLKPLPEENQVVPDQTRHQRADYNKTGRIDDIQEDQIVINDILRYITSSTQVFSNSNSPSLKKNLKPGQWVEFNVDQKNQILKIRVK